jgi:hypothetical protein
MPETNRRWHPTEEEFIAWRDEPVTQWVMAAFRKTAEDVGDAWSAKAWGTGVADQEELLVAKTRADAYMAVEEMSYENLVATFEETTNAG